MRSSPAGAAYGWARAAARDAGRVPATGAQAADWTVRGWAEVALGCAVLRSPAAFRGLDDAVRAAAVPCRGPFAARLRELRRMGGDLPSCYARGGRAAPRPAAVLTALTAQACEILAEFCDTLLSAPAPSWPAASPPAAGRPAVTRAELSGAPPPDAPLAQHVRWGVPLRPGAGGYAYQVLRAPVPARLAWRSWLFLPGAGGRQLTLLDLAAGSRPATAWQRVCHGIHNGAHLDHLAALAAADPEQTWLHAPAEFGAGLLSAEAFAMAVEVLAAAQCAAAGLAAEAGQLRSGLAERIGRIPGYRSWYRQRGRHRGSAALGAAAAVQVPEFRALPDLAASYVTGPLRLIAGSALSRGDALLPAALLGQFRGRWAAAAAAWPPAARLAERAATLAWPAPS